jgi:hypothetical protein
MAMQDTGKRSAGGSGANPALDADQAEQLAASFKPAWDIEEPDESTSVDAAMPGVVAAANADATLQGAPAVVVSHVITVVPSENGNIHEAPTVVRPVLAAEQEVPTAVRPAVQSTQELDSAALIEVVPPAAPAPPVPPPAAVVDMSRTIRMDPPPPPPPATSKAEARQPPPKTPPPRSQQPQSLSAPRTAPMMQTAKPKIPIQDPFAAKASSFDDDIVVPKKSGKGLVIGIVAVAVLGGAGAFVKFGMTGDEPAKKAESTQTAAPPATTQDIPPPAPKDDTPPPATTATTTPPAKAADNTTATATPPPAPPTPPPAAPAGHPSPSRDTTTAHADPGRGASHPAHPPSPPPAPPAPKAAPKSTAGGIVRDTPF